MKAYLPSVGANLVFALNRAITRIAPTENPYMNYCPSSGLDGTHGYEIEKS